jgi:hypothetical protein
LLAHSAHCARVVLQTGFVAAQSALERQPKHTPLATSHCF